MQFNLFQAASLLPPSWSWEFIKKGANNGFGDMYMTGSECKPKVSHDLLLLLIYCVYPGLMYSTKSALEMEGMKSFPSVL